MWLKHGVLTLILGATTLLPLGARAEHDDDRRGGRPRGSIEVHVHSDRCEHQHGEGRYELQRTQRWVPGYHQKVWVPEVCHEKHRRHGHGHKHGHKVVCQGGYYEQRWVEGRYETVEEWVRVPHREARPRVGVRLSASF